MSKQRDEMLEISKNALMFFENFIKLDGLKNMIIELFLGYCLLRKTMIQVSLIMLVDGLYITVPLAIK